jgi:mono/diheme cytochrome c family protein
MHDNSDMKGWDVMRNFAMWIVVLVFACSLGGTLVRSQTQPPASAAQTTAPAGDHAAVMQRGETTYKTVCATCHGPEGKGAPMVGAPEGTLMAPPLAGSTRVTGNPEYIVKVMLNGMLGPIDDKNYGAGIMVPFGNNSDEWISDVTSYVRNSFGNTAPFVTPEQVAAVRAANTRTTPWTFPELAPTIK